MAFQGTNRKLLGVADIDSRRFLVNAANASQRCTIYYDSTKRPNKKGEERAYLKIKTRDDAEFKYLVEWAGRVLQPDCWDTYEANHGYFRATPTGEHVLRIRYR